MNFNEAKDELLKWAVPVLLFGILSTLMTLSTDMTEQKSETKHAFYRLDQQRDQITAVRVDIGENKVKIGRIEMKLFGGDYR